MIVYFLMLRPVKKQIVTAFRELPAHVEHGEGRPAKAAASRAAARKIEIESPRAPSKANVPPRSSGSWWRR